MNHSLAPWSIRFPLDGKGKIIVSGSRTVCRVSGHLKEHEEIEANADLIAAAPELLESLKWAIASVGFVRGLDQHEEFVTACELLAGLTGDHTWIAEEEESGERDAMDVAHEAAEQRMIDEEGSA